MDTLKKPLGAVMLVYAVLYALQVVFSPLYAEALNPSEVWNVMNYCTAVGILISVGVVWGWVRGRGGERIGRYAAVFVVLALGVWFFSRWFKLLMMDEGEPVSEADNVVWAIVSVLVPMVLGASGLHLWRSQAMDKGS